MSVKWGLSSEAAASKGQWSNNDGSDTNGELRMSVCLIILVCGSVLWHFLIMNYLLQMHYAR